jgi:hypothetical protein
MSRSRKKEAVYKDPSNTKGKVFANRKLRRATKQAIHNEEEMPVLKEVMNTYDLVDFIERENKYDDPKNYEKLKRK